MEAYKLLTPREVYENSPEGEKLEILNGVVVVDMATPTRKHQEIVIRMSQKILNYIDAKGGDCKVYPAPFTVNLMEDERTWVEPDVSVICDRDKLTEQGCKGAPDWVIEVASKGSLSKDLKVKQELYLKAGVKEYWLICPETEIVIIFRDGGREIAINRFADLVNPMLPQFEGLEIRIADFLR